MPNYPPRQLVRPTPTSPNLHPSPSSPYFAPLALASPIQTPSSPSCSSIPSLSLDAELRRCWICFGDDLDSTGRWVKPCSCSLISHEECLLAWIHENQKGEIHKKVHCPQCNALYKLSEPPSFLVDLFVKVDRIISITVPYITMVGLTGSLLVTSTTYGAYAVLTVCGGDEGERLLGSPNPWSRRVWLGLPMIPWALIASRTSFFDSLMPILPILILGNDHIKFEYPPSPSLIISLLPWVRLFYNSAWSHLFGGMERRWRDQLHHQLLINPSTPQSESNDYQFELEVDIDLTNPTHSRVNSNTDDAVSRALGENRGVVRTVVGALMLPAISSMAGNLLTHLPLVKKVLPDTFLRSIVGGCLFVFLKDIAYLIYRYHLVRRLRKRTIQSVNGFQ